jgi:DNA-binding transcriptional ArsR family regulator
MSLRHHEEMEAIADADVAAVAALMGDRARCAMLTVLTDGSERPAGELAKAAGVSAATASGHLQRLVAGGLVTVRSSGRHRYYGLTGPLVAAAIEALSLISPPVEARSLRQSVTAAAMAEARSRYLAGALPSALLARFLELGWLDRRRTDRALTITELGHANPPTLGSGAQRNGLITRTPA